MTVDQTVVEVESARRARTRLSDAELTRVYTTHHALVRRLAIRFGVPPADVEDAVHDTFLELSTAMTRLGDAGSERSFIAGVTRNVVLRYKKNLFRHLRRVFAASETQHDAEVAEPHGAVEASIELHALMRCLGDDARQVFVLMELEEWTAPEVAEALQLKLPTVYSRHRSARLALADAITRRRATARSEP